jgi:hypothetical protein
VDEGVQPGLFGYVTKERHMEKDECKKCGRPAYAPNTLCKRCVNKKYGVTDEQRLVMEIKMLISHVENAIKWNTVPGDMCKRAVSSAKSLTKEFPKEW